LLALLQSGVMGGHVPLYELAHALVGVGWRDVDAPWLTVLCMGSLAVLLLVRAPSQFPLMRFGTSWTLPTFLEGKTGLTYGFIFILMVVTLRHTSPRIGCQSASAYGATISRVSASIVSEGYVYMAVSLTSLNMLSLTEVHHISLNRLKKKLRRGDKMVPWENLIRAGLILTMLTAFLPDRASDCHILGFRQSILDGDICYESLLGDIHLLGIGLGTVLSLMGCLGRLRESLLLVRPQMALSHASTLVTHEVRKALIHLACALIVLVCAGVTFLAIGGKVSEPARMHICLHYDTKATCEGAILWERAISRHERRALLEQWPCRWNASTPFSARACTNPTCGESQWYNKLRIAAEFVLLAFWVVAMVYALLVIRYIEIEECFNPARRFGAEPTRESQGEEIHLPECSAQSASEKESNLPQCSGQSPHKKEPHLPQCSGQSPQQKRW